MDHLPNPRRRRWNAFTALLLVLAALAAVNFVAPELFAQAGESAPGATVTQPAGEAIEQVEGNWKGALKVAIVIALFVGPVLVGAWLARTLRMPDHGWKFALAIGVVAAAAVVVSTGEIKLGPDLSGGITLIYELADESDQAAPAAQPAATGEASTNDASDDPATQEQDAGEGADAADAGAAAAADAEGDAPDADAAEDDSATDEPASDDSAAGELAAGDEQAPGDDADRPGSTLSRDDTIALLIATLTKRIDPTGTKEISVRKWGEGQIEIIIPRAEKQELEYIEQRISTSGLLVFRITASERFSSHQGLIKLARDLPPGQDIVRLDGIEQARWVEIDLGEFESLEVAAERGLVTRRSGEIPQALVLTNDGLDVTGDYIKSVTADVDETGRPQVSFSFDSAGAFAFGRLTGEHEPEAGVHYGLGILLDNRLLSAPQIDEKITDRGRIRGNMGEEEVNNLVEILQAGRLPAALNKTPISRAQISPTLGAQTVEKGKVALSVSLLLVAIFMVFYYRKAGVIACFGLAINMLLIVGCMVLIKAAFTLPGLAGLVLTVGMSVDANVLIYERIREELKRGAALRMAIRNGFDRATTTIIDSNVTNLITGIVIYKIAPDNVKGFGITLVLGIAMSIFVAVFLTRIVFDVVERKGWIKTLPMRELKFISNTNIDFLAWRRVCIAASLLIIAVGLAASFARRDDLFDIDFTGGSSVQFVLKEDEAMDFDEVWAALDKTPLKDKNLSLVKVGEADTHYSVTTVDDNVTEVERILQETFGDKLETYEVEVTDVAAIAGADATGQLHSAPRGDSLLPPLPMPLGSLALLQAPAGDAAPAEQPATAAPEDGAAPAGDANAGPDAASGAAPATGGTTTAGDAASTPAATGDAPEPAAGAASAGDAAAGVADPFAGGGTSATVRFRSTTGQEGVDMAGGVTFDTMEQLLSRALKAEGREGVAFEISNPGYKRGTVRNFPEWQIKVALPEAESRAVLARIENQLDDQAVFPLSNKIGGRVASRMATDAIAAIILCLAGIIGYVWFRFHGIMYGVAAVVALIHDVLISLGFVALSAYLVYGAEPLANMLLVDKFQVSLTLVAAFLTIIGYSLNDTIVIFDRIREVKGKSPRLTGDMINLAVNQCFARTLLTSFTSLISVCVLYVVGGAGIHAFAFALLVGFVAGVYSTIVIANPVLLWLTQRADASSASAGSRAA